jgi:hypothetical protein
MNKILTVTLIAFLAVLGSPIAILAQEEEPNVNEVDQKVVIEDVEGLRINMVQNIQDPGSKKIKFDVIIDSAINSDRVEVNWAINGQSVLDEGNAKEVLKVTANSQTTHSVIVNPVGFGVTRVKVIIQAFEIDGTRVATAAKAFVTDKERSLLVPDAQQQLANNIYVVRNVAAVILGIVVILSVIYLGYSYFRSWLESDKT